MTRAAAAACVVAVLAMSGCGGGTSVRDGERELTVLAASSLTDVFPTLAREFERRNPGVTVRFAFDSSFALADRAIEGAPGDVLATADTATMRRARDGGAIGGDPRRFAVNELVLAVPAGTPDGVRTVGDLRRATFVTCVATAPCGRLADRILEANRITAAPSSREVNVRAVLTRVRLGEADAGLVYRSDAVAASAEVDAVRLPRAGQSTVDSHIAVLRGASQPGMARAWIDFVTGATAAPVLTAAGFTLP